MLGLGEKWEGGNVKKYRGGGQKINIMKKELEKYKDQKDKIIIFTDRFVLVLLSLIFDRELSWMNIKSILQLCKKLIKFFAKQLWYGEKYWIFFSCSVYFITRKQLGEKEQLKNEILKWSQV